MDGIAKRNPLDQLLIFVEVSKGNRRSDSVVGDAVTESGVAVKPAFNRAVLHSYGVANPVTRDVLDSRESFLGFGQDHESLAVAVDCVRKQVKLRFEVENRPAKVAKRVENFRQPGCCGITEILILPGEFWHPRLADGIHRLLLNRARKDRLVEVESARRGNERLPVNRGDKLADVLKPNRLPGAQSVVSRRAPCSVVAVRVGKRTSELIDDCHG